MKAPLFLCCTAMIALNLHAQSFSLKDFQQLNWLASSWKMETRTGVLYEIWHYVDDSTFQSRSYKIRLSGDTIPLEQVKLCFRDNQVFYIPTVRGQNNEEPVPFRITSITSHSFKAENKEHDFPQFIEYNLESALKLQAAVYGKENGKERREEFMFGRML